jgi:hypothetical protein
MFKFKNVQILKIFKKIRKKRMKKRKGNKKPEITIKTRKKLKEKIARKKRTGRRVNEPAQRHAHGGGAKFGSTNGRSIGNAPGIGNPRTQLGSVEGEKGNQASHIRAGAKPECQAPHAQGQANRSASPPI